MTDKTKVTVRLNTDLYKSIKKSAVDANTTVGVHIEYLLFQALQIAK